MSSSLVFEIFKKSRQMTDLINMSIQGKDDYPEMFNMCGPQMEIPDVAKLKQI